MKHPKRLLLILQLLFLFFNATASHLKGGEIVYLQTGSLSYQFKLVMYTNIQSVDDFGVDEPDATLTFSDGTSQTVPRDAPGKIYLGNNTYKNVYTFNKSFASPGFYFARYQRDFRNHGILNMDNSGSASFYLETSINVTSTGVVNNFTFAEPPILLCEINQPFSFNPTVVNSEGDSLHFELTSPRKSSTEPVSGYKFPHLVSGSGSSFTIDPVSGQARWENPDLAGSYAVAILIKKYRNGILRGLCIRDYLIDVVSEDLTQQYISATSNLPFDTNNHFETENEIDLDIEVVFTDSLAKASELKCISDLFTKGATFSVTDTGSSGKKGKFNFTIDSTVFRRAPYMVVFRSKSVNGDKMIYNDLTYTLYLGSQIALGTRKKHLFSILIFPNPATDYVSLELESEHDYSAEILDGTGRVRIKEAMVSPQNRLDVSGLEAGIYLFRILEEGEEVYRGKLMKHDE